MYIYFVIERKYQHLDIMLLMKDSAALFFLILKHISQLQILLSDVKIYYFLNFVFHPSHLALFKFEIIFHWFKKKT